MIDYARCDRLALIRSVEPGWLERLEVRFMLWLTRFAP